MSVEQNKAVVRRFAEEFKNKANLDIVMCWRGFRSPLP
jgi:hypothetical protein